MRLRPLLWLADVRSLAFALLAFLIFSPCCEDDNSSASYKDRRRPAVRVYKSTEEHGNTLTHVNYVRINASLIKDLSSYEQEAKDRLADIETIKASGKDEYDVRQAVRNLTPFGLYFQLLQIDCVFQSC